MAKNTVKTDFIVDDKGSIKKLGREADKTSKSTKNLANNARTADRNIKGAAQASSNGTKNFSKMAQGVGGLVGAYATLAANIFAITAAFNFLKSAADFRVLTEGQEAFANKTGQSLSLLTSRVQAATGGLLKFDEAAQAVSIGTAAGLDPSQIEGLAAVAKKASMALGRDLTDSFNRLTRGAIKAEPELLDELGIILRLETASQKYADALGLNANELTTFQKQQAVVNEVLEQGNTKFEDLGGNVNQIAKLGKAFDDLIKRIQRIIGPVAEFIGGALSNNITALAGAFALLGTGITKSLAGAPPALADISEGAKEARLQLTQGANIASKTGQRVADPDALLSSRDLDLVEKSAGRKHTTIMKFDNLTKDQTIRNVRLIRAQQQMALAQQTTGMKRYHAQFKAELEILRIQHGKVMGTMTAATQAFARGANRILGAVGMLGLLFSLIGLLQQFINSLKSPEFKKFMDNSKTLAGILEEQNSKVAELQQNLKETKTEAAAIEQKFQLISNIKFDNIEGLTVPKIVTNRFGGASQIGKGGESLEMAESGLKNVGETITSLRLQINSLGKDSPEAAGLVQILNKLEPAFNRATEVAGNFGGQFSQNADKVAEFNTLTGIINTETGKLNDTNKEAIKTTTQQRTGLKSLTVAGEEFLTLQRKMRQAPSDFTSFFKILEDMQSGLRDSGIKDFKNLTDEQQTAVKDILGELEQTTKVTDIITKMEGIKAEILKAELILTRRRFQIDEKYEKALRGTTKLVAAQLKIDQKRENLQLEIFKIQEKQRLNEYARTPLGKTQKKIDADRLQLLREQLITLNEQQDVLSRINRSGEQGLESGLQSNISALLKGTEKSFKTAIANIAKSTLEAMADELSKIVTEAIMKRVLKRKTVDEKIQIAHQVGGEIVKQKIIEGHAVGANIPKPNSDGGGNKDTELVSELTGQSLGVRAGSSSTKSGEVINEVTFGSGQKGIFASFIQSLKNIFDPSTGDFIDRLKFAFSDGVFALTHGLDLVLDNFLGLFGGKKDGGGVITGLVSSFFSLFGGASGGIMTPRGKMSGYSTGGIARGAQSGYPAVLHGTEAVVPLPNGRSIPVDMKGGGTQNNIVVNITTDGRVSTEGSTGPDMDQMGTAIAKAVQIELQNQKRSGGMLSPYGPA